MLVESLPKNTFSKDESFLCVCVFEDFACDNMTLTFSKWLLTFFFCLVGALNLAMICINLFKIVFD